MIEACSECGTPGEYAEDTVCPDDPVEYSCGNCLDQWVAKWKVSIEDPW